MILFGPPFSKFRKILWIVCFVMALVSAPGCFIDGVAPGKQREYAFWTAFNLFACWWSFDQTWEYEKDEEE